MVFEYMSGSDLCFEIVKECAIDIHLQFLVGRKILIKEPSDITC
jgi:hypothetical protein